MAKNTHKKIEQLIVFKCPFKECTLFYDSILGLKRHIAFYDHTMFFSEDKCFKCPQYGCEYTVFCKRSNTLLVHIEESHSKKNITSMKEITRKTVKSIRTESILIDNTLFQSRTSPETRWDDKSIVEKDFKNSIFKSNEGHGSDKNDGINVKNDENGCCTQQSSSINEEINSSFLQNEKIHLVDPKNEIIEERSQVDERTSDDIKDADSAHELVNLYKRPRMSTLKNKSNNDDIERIIALGGPELVKKHSHGNDSQSLGHSVGPGSFYPENILNTSTVLNNPVIDADSEKAQSVHGNFLSNDRQKIRKSIESMFKDDDPDMVYISLVQLRNKESIIFKILNFAFPNSIIKMNDLDKPRLFFCGIQGCGKHFKSIMAYKYHCNTFLHSFFSLYDSFCRNNSIEIDYESIIEEFRRVSNIKDKFILVNIVHHSVFSPDQYFPVIFSTSKDFIMKNKRNKKRAMNLTEYNYIFADDLSITEISDQFESIPSKITFRGQRYLPEKLNDQEIINTEKFISPGGLKQDTQQQYSNIPENKDLSNVEKSKNAEIGKERNSHDEPSATEKDSVNEGGRPISNIVGVKDYENDVTVKSSNLENIMIQQDRIDNIQENTTTQASSGHISDYMDPNKSQKTDLFHFLNLKQEITASSRLKNVFCVCTREITKKSKKIFDFYPEDAKIIFFNKKKEFQRFKFNFGYVRKVIILRIEGPLLYFCLFNDGHLRYFQDDTQLSFFDQPNITLFVLLDGYKTEEVVLCNSFQLFKYKSGILTSTSTTFTFPILAIEARCTLNTSKYQKTRETEEKNIEKGSFEISQNKNRHEDVSQEIKDIRKYNQRVFQEKKDAFEYSSDILKSSGNDPQTFNKAHSKFTRNSNISREDRIRMDNMAERSQKEETNIYPDFHNEIYLLDVNGKIFYCDSVFRNEQDIYTNVGTTSLFYLKDLDAFLLCDSFLGTTKIMYCHDSNKKVTVLQSNYTSCVENHNKTLITGSFDGQINTNQILNQKKISFERLFKLIRKKDHFLLCCSETELDHYKTSDMELSLSLTIMFVYHINKHIVFGIENGLVLFVEI